MEFTMKQISQTLNDYKLFVEEQQVLSSSMFKEIIDRVNTTSEDLSRTKTDMLVFLQQLDSKNTELREEMKKELVETKIQLEELKKELEKTKTEMHQIQRNLAPSFVSEW